MGNSDFILKANPIKLLFKLSLPAIIGMLVIGLYNFMDAVFVGKMISDTAMGAISVVYPFTIINSGIATLIGVGSASVLSRAIGKKDQKTIDKILGNLTTCILILSVIYMVIGEIFARELLALTGAQGEILNLGVRYMRVVLGASIFVNFAQSSNMLLRAQGMMKQAMFVMGFGALLNIALDPLLIWAFGSKGIEGAASATFIAQTVQAGMMLFYYLKKSDFVKFNKIKIDFKLLPGVLSVGFSAMLMQVMYFVQQMVTYNTITSIGGDNQVILIGAALKVSAFCFIPLWGISQGFQPAIGTNFGAKEYGRVNKITATFLVAATAMALFFWIFMQAIPGPLLSMFMNNKALIASGITNFRIMFAIFPLCGAMIIAITFFQSIGKAAPAGILVLARQVVIFVPLVIVLGKFVGITGVWMTTPIVDGFVTVLAMILMAIKCIQFAKLEKSKPISSKDELNNSNIEGELAPTMEISADKAIETLHPTEISESKLSADN